MASGKSTTGRRLARLLGWPFYDTDAEVVRVHGAIEQIFEEEGETAFRVYELEALTRTLEQEPRSVIAVGGGAPAHEATRRLLAAGAHRVFLDASVEQIVDRLRHAHAVRPVLGADPDEERVRALYAQRMPFYAEAETIVDCSGLKISTIARRVEEQLRLAGVI